MSNIFSLVVSLFITFSVAFLGSFFTVSSIDSWYATLLKPALNPPNWIFGPVWTLLYTLMAVSAWRVWKLRDRNKQVKPSLFVYLLHLGVNAFWSIAFFGLQSPLFAFGIIIVLLAMILGLFVGFYRIDKTTGLLFLPYLAWVSFATYLNLSIVLLN